jgi:cytochrome c oxidase subunit IV
VQQPRTVDQRAVGNVGRLAVWTIAWVATLALAKFGPDLWNSQPALSWAAIVVNLIVGAGWIVAHARFLRGVDDLQRKIFLDAIAVALGVGIVGGCALAAASSIGLISFDADIALLSILMAVVYVIGVLIGTLRYR